MPEFVVVSDRTGGLRRLPIPRAVRAAGRDAVAAYADAPPPDALAKAEVFVPDAAVEVATPVAPDPVAPAPVVPLPDHPAPAEEAED